MGVEGMEFDFLDLKCFGLNSMDGAIISEELRDEYKNQFLKDWNKFFAHFIDKYDKN